MTGPLPRLAVWLIRRSVRPSLAEDVLGDLEAAWREEHSPPRAYTRLLRIGGGVWWHGRRNREVADGRNPRAVLDDVRFALRSVVRRPRLSAAAVLTLALGLGSSTAMLTAARTVVLPELPYPDSARLVHLWASWPGGFGNLAYPDIEAVRAAVPALDGVAAYESWGTLALGGGDRPMTLKPTFVSSEYLPMLGARAAVGRLFEAADHRPGASAVAILSEGLWRRRFGADPEIVGTTLVLNALPFRVVGVIRDPFASLGEAENPPSDIWLPASAAPPLLGQLPLTEVVRIFWGVGHLAPHATLEQVRQQVAAVAAQLADERPRTHRGYRLEAQSLAEFLHGAIVAPARLLIAGSLLMLLISCANVANLLLTRAAERRGEFAVRVALGASRRRLMSQALSESLILAGAGALLGGVLATFLLGALATFVALRVSPFVALRGSLAAFGIAATLGLLTAMAVGVGPAIAAARVDVAERVALTSRAGALRGRHRLRGTLVIIEVAVAVVLLVGVGLLTRSFERVAGSGVGFATDRLLTFRLDLAGDRYAADAARIHFAESFVSTVEAVPGVESATIWGPSMLGRATWVMSVLPEGRPADRPEAFVMGFFHLTSPDGLHKLGIPLLSGREISPVDRPGASPVAVVSEDLARAWWPNDVREAIGKRLQRVDSTLPLLTIVGIARNARQRDRYSLAGIAAGLAPSGLQAQRDLYLPYAQRPTHAMTVAVRVRDPRETTGPVRRAVASLDPELAVDDIRTLDDRLAEQNGGLAALAALMGVYALLAALLAGVGLYSAVANAVLERRREIGVRIALGARTGRVLGLVLRQSGTLIVVGLGVGLVVAASLASLVRTLLYGVTPVDLESFAAATGFLALLGLIALWAPVTRATRIDPVETLREP